MNSFAKFQRFIFVVLIAVIFFYGGNYFGFKGYEIQLKKSPPVVKIEHKENPADGVDFALFWTVWDELHQRYLERPVDSQKMLYGAISGMVNSLDDPYTTFLIPTTNENMKSALNGEYQGIGAELGTEDNQLIIIAPIDGSPAKKAGIKSGDKILKIDGVDTYGLGVTDAVLKIRGTAGTTVKLTLARADTPEPFDVEIVRGVVTLNSVIWEDKGDGIAYIRINRFGGDTNDQWDKAVSEINTKMTQLDSVVIDVRQNPGGYLNSAVHIASEFMSDTPVIYQEDATGTQVPFNAAKLGSFENVPGLFVLIDGGSASASEILAGALKDTKKAVLIGEKSFGKGTIQDAKDYGDGSGIHITIAKWLTPNKTWVHKQGIEPDVKVEVKEEDVKNGVDATLDKALEMAKKF